jgi:hypothetical protein
VSTVRRFFAFVGGLVVALLVAAGAFNLLAVASVHRFSVRSSYSGVTSLAVSTGSGDVHLRGAPAGSPVVVVAHVTEAFTTPHRHALRPRPGALTLNYSCAVFVECSVSYDVSVPAGVTVKASSGDGDVDARGLSAAQISLSSGNGDVNATLTRPASTLSASSGDGNVTLVVPDTTYDLHASSGNGSVNDQTVRIDHASPRRINASSGNGDVTVTTAR